MKRMARTFAWLQTVLFLGVAVILFAGQELEPGEALPSPRQLWERLKKTLPSFSYSILKDELVQSDTDPERRLRRIEVRFISQTINGDEMGHTGVIYMPADGLELQKPSRKGKVVIVAHIFGDDTMELNYAEPIAAKTGYPTMSLPLPGDYNGEYGDRIWWRSLRQLAMDTNDPIHHDLFRYAVPYIRALDVFSDLLKEKDIRAVIGGHSARAYFAFTAAAIAPEKIAGVVYMGCESLFSDGERFADLPDGTALSEEQVFRKALHPFHTQKYVQCPVLYLGATNEGAYAMFNINKIQERMGKKWTIEYIPNYRHDSRSEKQFMDWQMWVSNIFDGRPITQIHNLSFYRDTQGTYFRARIDTNNKIIQVKAWYVHCHNDPYWRNLMWFPVIMKQKQADSYEGYVSGELPDAWFVEVKDIAHGFPGYISSLPQDITHKPVKDRSER